MKKIKAIIYGVGAMGSGMVRSILGREWIEIVGAIDKDNLNTMNKHASKIGKDLGEVVGIGRRIGVIVSDNSDVVLAEAKADLVLHATSPVTDEVEKQVLKCVEAGCNVISIAEARLVYPWIHHIELGRRIDEAAKRNSVTVHFTGINPGFMMDLIPIMLTGVCASVRKINMWRLLDISPFGPDTLGGMGIGLTIDGFNKGLSDGTIGWILPETLPQIDMIDDTLDLKLDETRRIIKPLTSNRKKKTPYGTEIREGDVCGDKWLYHGIKNGESLINIEWIHFLYPEEDGLKPEDRFYIEGESDIELTINKLDSGVGTFAHPVNSIPQVMKACPGLVTIRDLPVATALT